MQLRPATGAGCARTSGAMAFAPACGRAAVAQLVYQRGIKLRIALYGYYTDYLITGGPSLGHIYVIYNIFIN